MVVAGGFVVADGEHLCLRSVGRIGLELPAVCRGGAGDVDGLAIRCLDDIQAVSDDLALGRKRRRRCEGKHELLRRRAVRRIDIGVCAVSRGTSPEVENKVPAEGGPKREGAVTVRDDGPTLSVGAVGSILLNVRSSRGASRIDVEHLAGPNVPDGAPGRAV